MIEPFDSALCPTATLADLKPDQIKWFITTARQRQAPTIPKDAPHKDVLESLHLTRDGRPTNAAVLLFGNTAQRLLNLPPIKCLHYEGLTPDSPITAQHTVDGSTIFEWIFQTTLFIMKAVSYPPQRFDLPQYEIPKEAIREAMVNALVHQDYTSGTATQVTIYHDRIEVSNPGGLPPALSLDQLRQRHSSLPRNTLLAQTLHLTDTFPGAGTGTNDMISHCLKAGLHEPRFMLKHGFTVCLHRPRPHRPKPVGGQTGGGAKPAPAPVPARPIDPKVMDLVRLLARTGPLKSVEILKYLGLKDRTHMRQRYLDPALYLGLIELTIPDQPRSANQQYRLTAKGKAL